MRLMGLVLAMTLGLSGCATLTQVTESEEFKKSCVGTRIALKALEAVQEDPALQDPDVKMGFNVGMNALRMHQSYCPPEEVVLANVHTADDNDEGGSSAEI